MKFSFIYFTMLHIRGKPSLALSMFQYSIEFLSGYFSLLTSYDEDLDLDLDLLFLSLLFSPLITLRHDL